MAFNTQELAKLRRIVSLAEKLIAASPKPKRGRPALLKGNGSSQNGSTRKRTRRTGKDLLAFRKMLKAQRRRGVPVAEIARKHGISTTYVYLL